MKWNIEPYDGILPYAFLCYCHQNDGLVEPVARQLEQLGLRIWYDDGVSLGDEWPEVVAARLEGCEIFIAALSSEASASHNCRSELTRALELGKPLFAVELDGAPLTRGVQLQLKAAQGVWLASGAEAIARHALASPCLRLDTPKFDLPPQPPVVPPVAPPMPFGGDPGATEAVEAGDAPYIVNLSSGLMQRGDAAWTTIGTDAGSQIRIDAPGMPGACIYLLQHEGRRWVKVCDSVHGATVNGQSVNSGDKLEMLDEAAITVGGVRLLAVYGAKADSLRQSRRLVSLYHLANRTTRYCLEPVTLLGRINAWPCGALSSGLIGREHADVTVGPEGAYVVDHSRNGTWIGAERLMKDTPAPLRDGDRLTLAMAEVLLVHILALEEAVR